MGAAGGRRQRWEAHVGPRSPGSTSRLLSTKPASAEPTTGSSIGRPREVEVIHHGLEEQRRARNVAGLVDAERNQFDGIRSAAEARRAALQRAQLKGFAPASQRPRTPRSPGIEM